MSDTYITHFGGTGTPIGRRMGGDIVGPSGGTPIAYTKDNMIFLGPTGTGVAQFYFDGKYVRAGSNQGPVVFNIRDNGSSISIGDGMGQSHHLSTTDKGDPMALAATACAWLGDMHLRNPRADVVDGGDYIDRINGQALHDSRDFNLTRGENSVRWADNPVPEDLLARFGKDNLSHDLNKRLIESRIPSSASKRYEWCGGSAYLLKQEAAKEAEEIARSAGLNTYEFDGDTLLCQGAEQPEAYFGSQRWMDAVNAIHIPMTEAENKRYKKYYCLPWYGGMAVWAVVITLLWLLIFY